MSAMVGAGIVLGTLVTGPAASAATSARQGPFSTLETCEMFRDRAWRTGAYSYVGACYAYRPLNQFQGFFFNTTTW